MTSTVRPSTVKGRLSAGSLWWTRMLMRVPALAGSTLDLLTDAAVQDVADACADLTAVVTAEQVRRSRR